MKRVFFILLFVVNCFGLLNAQTNLPTWSRLVQAPPLELGFSNNVLWGYFGFGAGATPPFVGYSTDFGDNWTSLGEDWEMYTPGDLGIYLTHEDTLFSVNGTQLTQLHIAAWLEDDEFHDIYLLGDTLYAELTPSPAFMNGRSYRSGDGGTTWTAFGEASRPGNGSIAIQLFEQNPGTPYFTCDFFIGDTVLLTTDFNTFVSRSAEDVEEVFAWANNLYYVADETAFRSTNGGSSWEDISTGVMDTVSGFQMQVDAETAYENVSDGFVVLSTAASGFFMQQSGTWSQLTDLPLPNQQTDEFPGDASRFWRYGDFLFADGNYAFDGRSLTRIDVSGLTGTVSRQEASQIAGVVAYPNPAQDELQVQVDASNATLRLYSLQGQLLHTHEFAHDATLDISKLPAGVLFATVTN